MASVMEADSRTVAVRTPLEGMPVPSVERIAGLTTTMYAIVKKVVIPATASVRSDFMDRRVKPHSNWPITRSDEAYDARPRIPTAGISRAPADHRLAERELSFR